MNWDLSPAQARVCWWAEYATLEDMECCEQDDEYDPENALCTYCGGEGWGIVGVNWDSDDPINGPYDGDIERCPNCHGSGFARDMTFW